MNEKMLKKIYELSNGTETAIDEDEFLKSFPDSQATRDGLKMLRALGYIDVVYRDGRIHFIFPLKKTLNRYG